MLTILCGDSLTKLRELQDESVQCCVTSPPYWGLRDYGNDSQIGLEKTPEEYVAKMVEVFREVRRVLRKDGTLWLNLGDSYHGSWGNSGSRPELDGKTQNQRQKSVDYLPRGGWDERRERPSSSYKIPGLKPKDLVGIPWRVAFALQGDGWWLRSDIIWNKANCMPESVTDRPTRSHEYLFLMTKSARYYYDAEAIKEPASESDWESRVGRAKLNHKTMPTDLINGIRPSVKYTPNGKDKHGWDAMEKVEQCSGTRNKRDVWTIAPANFPEAHFATYPPDLIKPCIMAGTRAGDTVLDPFAGSGTTGMVSLDLGRQAILIELNPKYVELIEQRCDVTPGLPL